MKLKETIVDIFEEMWFACMLVILSPLLIGVSILFSRSKNPKFQVIN